MGRLLLVRHGQASWGADDYDVLSPLGHEQGVALGEVWRARKVVPDRVIIGGMRRHRETAVEARLGDLVVDAGWDEFDHVGMLDKLPVPEEAATDRAVFQRWFETATDRWTDGGYDDYAESFAEFGARVEDALARAASYPGLTAVVTSGGPIAWTAATLLADDPQVRVGLWRRLNPVCVNTGVTHVVSGRRGRTLISFNEHTHLEGRPDLLSYR